MKLLRTAFNQEELFHFSEAIENEWLITKGLGGYASSALLGINKKVPWAAGCRVFHLFSRISA
jgi:hypothetical protein